VLVKGIFERDEDKAKLKANEIVSIDAVRERAARSVAVRLTMPPHDRATIEAVLASCRATGRPARDVRDRTAGGGRSAPVRADLQGPTRVRPTADLLAELERICGPGSAVLR